MTDGEEVDQDTDPTRSDTDDDGFGDSDEIDAGSDPLDPDSTPENVGENDEEDDMTVDEDADDTEEESTEESEDDESLDEEESSDEQFFDEEGGELEEEASSMNDEDDDDDGLSDEEERELGTDPDSNDTDKDGFDDATEIKNGYDPLGKGKLTDSLRYRVRGGIYLAVEQHGEAWYIDPQNLLRYYLGRADAALELVRKRGIGITNADIAKIEIGILAVSSSEFALEHMGKIFLQVESHGEAWYVYPKDLKRYYLGSPEMMMQIMIQLGIGISNKDLNEIPIAHDSPLLPGEKSSPIEVNPQSKPQVLPTYDSLQLFSSGLFGKKIPATLAVDPKSSTYVQSFVQDGSLVFLHRTFTFPVYFADKNTKRVDIPLPCGSAWELGINKMKNVPIPDFAEASDDISGVTIPAGRCAEDVAADNNMVILDLDTRCEYDLWQARKVNGSWEASWGSGLSMDSDGIQPHGMSSRGSGFSFLGGVVWPNEFESGIHHAMVFSYPFTKAGGPVFPATDSDGEDTRAFAIPEGALVRLDPSVDISAFPARERAIAKAMQEYGMYLVDNGGESGIAIYGVDAKSAAVDPYGIGGESISLANIPLGRLQVMKLPPQDADFRSKLRPASNSCITYE